MKKNILLVILLALLVAGAGVFLVVNNLNKSKTTTDNKSSNSTEDTNKQLDDNTVVVVGKTVEVVYSSNSFSPQNVTINKNDTVKFIIKDGSAQVASNPHPTHTGYPEFDSLSSLKADQAYEFTFTKAGTFGYHNHLNTSQIGTVIVK